MVTVNSRQAFLFELKKLLPPLSCGVEIGVLQGEFSRMILDIIKPAYLTLIDPYEVGGDKYMDGLSTAYSSNEDYITMANSLATEISSNKVIVRKMYSYEAVKLYGKNSFDFFYLDASHLYEDTKRDLIEWLPTVHEDALICGHDYADISNFGVIRAVNEFMREYNFEMVLFNENGGDWALRKIKN